MKNKKYLYQSIYKILPAVLILLTIYTAVVPETARAQNPQPTGIEVTAQNNFGQKFRAGRDLIDRQQWARAANIFREAVEKYPDDKSADAALYWLAFCYKKQKNFKEAAAALDRLLEKFPASSWAGDAQVMKLEIAPWAGGLYDSRSINSKINPKLRKEQFSSDLQADVVKGTLKDSAQNTALLDKLRMSERVPLDRRDEIKLAAFQSLLVADPKRAIETMGKVLKPDSEASEILKQEILRVWRNPRLFASQMLTSNISKSPGKEEFVSLLRETLARSFQNETNPKIRKEIIYALASLADNQATDYLKKLYAAESDREIKKAIINSFGNSENAFYDFKATQKQKAQLDISREQTHRIGFDVLLEIVRAEKDVELRRMAFSNLQRFQNWSASEQAVDLMTSLYDAETDEEFKVSVIRAFAESKQNQAIRKLLDIAKNDKSDRLRLEAIYSLRTSKDPEVLKFLEDLIK